MVSRLREEQVHLLSSDIHICDSCTVTQGFKSQNWKVLSITLLNMYAGSASIKNPTIDPQSEGFKFSCELLFNASVWHIEIH